MRVFTLVLLIAFTLAACATTPPRRLAARRQAPVLTTGSIPDGPPIEYSRVRSEPLITPERDPFAVD